MVSYPRVVVDLKKFRNNVEQIVKRCDEKDIKITGVIKGYTGIAECSKEFELGGAAFLGSSRLEQLEEAKNAGVKVPLMAIRVPMLSEVKNVVEVADYSLNSEIQVLKALNQAAKEAGKIHNVILMIDLGDLREGFWDKEELIKAALMVENDLENLHLAGTGTNLGCYGAILGTPEKLKELIADTEKIEELIGRKVEIISGGATNSIPRLIEDNMPERINHLRVGEGIIIAKDLPELYGYNMDYMYKDTFVLEAEIIEIKDKPSYPVGEIGYDAFGKKQEYVDIGIRKRALVAVGKVDYAYLDSIFPIDADIKVLGASSDHTILDIEDVGKELSIGDIVQFEVNYASIVFVTNNPNVKIDFV